MYVSRGKPVSDAFQEFMAERFKKEDAGKVSAFGALEEIALEIYDQWLIKRGYVKRCERTTER